MALYRKIHKRQRSLTGRGWNEVGDVVAFSPADLRNFADQWEPLDPPTDDPDELPPLSNLEIRSRGGGWFNVVNVELDKILNPRPLRRDDAEALLQDLL